MGYMGSYYNITKAIFYLLKGDYNPYTPNLETKALQPHPRHPEPDQPQVGSSYMSYRGFRGQGLGKRVALLLGV